MIFFIVVSFYLFHCSHIEDNFSPCFEKLSFLTKFDGIVQYIVFLSFLPPLTNFGSVTPIPVDIRVIGVEHPRGLNCSREEGDKTKLIPPWCFSFHSFFHNSLNLLLSLCIVFLNPFHPFLQLEIIFPQTCPFMLLMYFV